MRKAFVYYTFARLLVIAANLWAKYDSHLQAFFVTALFFFSGHQQHAAHTSTKKPYCTLLSRSKHSVEKAVRMVMRICCICSLPSFACDSPRYIRNRHINLINRFLKYQSSCHLPAVSHRILRCTAHPPPKYTAAR